MRPLLPIFLFTGLLSAPLAAQAQQPTPAVALSEDSVRVMSGLVQASVRQLREIYFEPSDARATQLIDKALQEIPTLNQRLSHYTASLPREQQQLLAQRLRQQPWQIELQTLMRSPQFKGFDARAAKNPDLKAATDRLHASGFAGTAKPAPAVAAAPEPMGTISLPPAKAGKPAPTANTLAATKTGAAAKSPATFKVAPVTTPAKPAPAAPAPAKTATATAPTTPAATSATAARHTVQKGETLFSIARQYGVTPAQLQTWNKKAEGGVKIGEVLVVEAGK